MTLDPADRQLDHVRLIDGRSKIQRSVRTMLVEMGAILPQHRAKVPFAEDQDLVDELG